MTYKYLLFISSIADEVLRSQLENHLTSLKARQIEFWHNSSLLPGCDVEEQLPTIVAQAKIAVLLLSSDFMASEDCQKLLALVQAEQARRPIQIVSILARPFDMSADAPAPGVMIPRNGKAVTSWDDRDKAWRAVARELRYIVTGFPTPTGDEVDASLKSTLAPPRYARYHGPRPARTKAERRRILLGAGCTLIGSIGAAAMLFPNHELPIWDTRARYLPTSVQLGLIAVFALVGIWFIVDGFYRRSRLLALDALTLRANNAAHLKGRRDHIDRLLRLCQEHRQVHLVGESGAGKTALVRAGLCSELRNEFHRGLLPIYLDAWGDDWEAGPRHTLARALFDALDENGRKVLRLQQPPAPQDVLDVLGEIKTAMRQTPLCLFDQFDDYQTRHRDEFLPNGRHVWLSTQALSMRNEFWRQIGALISEEKLHCLFVTRDDTADGLESIRFFEPQVYRLDRLPTHVVLELFDSLTADPETPVIFEPEHGWDRLKQQLAIDLSQDGAVLPVQMKLALQGLQYLDELTLRAYMRNDGLRGLEASQIEFQVSATAQSTRLNKSQIRSLLRELVDSEALKTVPRTAEMIEKRIIGNASDLRTKRAVTAALDDLTKKELLRRRPDADRGQPVWVLDHDYLCRGVLAAEHRADRWHLMARQAAQAFTQAGDNLWQKWRALLAPTQQIMLAVQRLRGRFRYIGLRAYAAWSLLRFLPFVISLAIAGWGWRQYMERQQTAKDDQKAASIIAGLGSKYQTISLWDLAGSSDSIRDRFLQQVLQHPSYAERLTEPLLAHVVTALIGLDIQRRQKILDTQIIPCLRSPYEVGKTWACMQIGLELSAMCELPKQAEVDVLQTLVASFPDAIQDLKRLRYELALQQVVDHLSQEHTSQTLDFLLQLTLETTDYTQLQGIFFVLQRLAPRLTAKQAQTMVLSLLQTLRVTGDDEKREALGIHLRELAGHQTPEQAVAASEAWIFAIKTSTNPQELKSLSEGLDAWAVTPTAEQAAIAFAPLFYLLEKIFQSRDLTVPLIADSQVSAALAKGLATLASKLTVKQTRTTSALLVAALQRPSSPQTLKSFVGALAKVSPSLTDGQAQNILANLLANRPTARDGMSELSGSFDAVQDGIQGLLSILSKPQAQQALVVLHSALKKAPSIGWRGVLLRAMIKAPVDLTSEQAKSILELLLVTIQHTSSGPILNARDELSSELELFLPKLTVAQQQMAASVLLHALQQDTVPNRLYPLLRGLSVIALTDAQMQDLCTSLFAALYKADGLFFHGIWPMANTVAAGLVLFKNKLTTEQLQTAKFALWAAIHKSDDSQALPILLSGLLALPIKLTHQESLSLLTSVVTALNAASPPVTLHEALKQLVAKLSADSVQAAAGVIVSGLTQVRDIDVQAALIQGLAALPAPLTNEQAQRAVSTLLPLLESPSFIPPWLDFRIAEALTAFMAKLTPKQAQASWNRIRIALEQGTKDPDTAVATAISMELMRVDAAPSTLLDLLKWPTFAEGTIDLRSKLLRKLEQQTRQDFQGNLWQMIRWIQQQHKDREWKYDLRAPLANRPPFSIDVGIVLPPPDDPMMRIN